MSNSHFKELKEWSERKHELLIKYLDGFVRILGGPSKGIIYYVDGFAGPGLYKDGGKGSPLRAVEFAQSIIDRKYTLRCINVEENETHFENLQSVINPYNDIATCFQGRFKNHIEVILSMVSDYPTIFFLDPFGIKGIEWDCLKPILTRQKITEALIRINPTDISRLAGFSGSKAKEAVSKRDLLTKLYGFKSSHEWEKVWHSEGTEGLVKLYKRRILETITGIRDHAYVCTYPIKTIQGKLKYFLLFSTCHPKGAILMSRIVYSREKSYDRDVKEYEKWIKESDPNRQTDLFNDLYKRPTEEEIEELIVTQLSSAIWIQCKGKNLSRNEIEMALLSDWFGKASGSHYTQALKKLENEEQIIRKTGSISSDNTKFRFKDP